MLRPFTLIFLIYAAYFLGCETELNNKNNMSNKNQDTFETTVNIPVKLNYSLYVPDDYDETSTEFPLVLYLHGVGERGEDLSKLELNGIPELIGKGKKLPFITLAPQCPDFGWWSRPEYVEALASLVKNIISGHKVDKQRVYVTGLSMGGYGALALAKKYPNLFAAIIPVCGGMDDHSDIKKLKDLPIWLFHGDQDQTHPVESSIIIHDLLKPINKEIKLTIYEGIGHNSWDMTYANDEIYDWLLSHKKD